MVANGYCRPLLPFMLANSDHFWTLLVSCGRSWLMLLTPFATVGCSLGDFCHVYSTFGLFRPLCHFCYFFFNSIACTHSGGCIPASTPAPLAASFHPLQLPHPPQYPLSLHPTQPQHPFQYPHLHQQSVPVAIATVSHRFGTNNHCTLTACTSSQPEKVL